MAEAAGLSAPRVQVRVPLRGRVPALVQAAPVADANAASAGRFATRVRPVAVLGPALAIVAV